MTGGDACFFIGHGKPPKDRIDPIIRHLDREVEFLMRQGVTSFISGGAPGFDLVAAALIVAKKEIGRNVRLIFALPTKTI